MNLKELFFREKAKFPGGFRLFPTLLLLPATLDQCYLTARYTYFTTGNKNVSFGNKIVLLPVTSDAL